MTTPFDRVRQRLEELDEAPVESESADAVPAEDWLEAPDPFGLDWQWLPPFEDSSTALRSPQLTPAPSAFKDEATQRSRGWSTIAVTSLAASLLAGLMLGWIVFHGGDPQQLQILAAGGSAAYVSARGADELQVEVDSPFEGFSTLIALAPNRKPQVYPPFGGDDVPVSAGEASAPVTVREGTERVLAVVTQTPAGESIRRLIDDDPNADFAPEDIEKLQKEVQQLLERKGYLKLAFADISVDDSAAE